MDVHGVRRHIESSFPGVEVSEDDGSLFFTRGARKGGAGFQPFATLVVSDRYDPASTSDLARRGAFRLNIGVPMAEYRRRFGDPPPFPKDGGVAEPGRDYAALDTLMPHPVYAAMGWVSVLDPDRSWPEASGLLALAYAHAARQG